MYAFRGNSDDIKKLPKLIFALMLNLTALHLRAELELLTCWGFFRRKSIYDALRQYIFVIHIYKWQEWPPNSTSFDSKEQSGL